MVPAKAGSAYEVNDVIVIGEQANTICRTVYVMLNADGPLSDFVCKLLTAHKLK